MSAVTATEQATPPHLMHKGGQLVLEPCEGHAARLNCRLRVGSVGQRVLATPHAPPPALDLRSGMQGNVSAFLVN